MGSIINLHGDLHEEALMLLPWYATGQLDQEERAAVEAHLAVCAACQTELSVERKLRSHVAGLPVDEATGWARLCDQLESRAPEASRRPPMWRTLFQQPFAGWALAAQLVLAVIALSLLVPAQRPSPYRTLSDVSAPAANGNAIIIFRPDVTEAAFRQMLVATGARLVGGPTSSHAYMLQISPADRQAALARLRARPEVVLAEPIDGDAGP